MASPRHEAANADTAMTRKALWISFASFLLATFAHGLFLQLQGRSLSVLGELPGGIVAFELAGSERRATEIVELWRSKGLLEVASDQIRLDFLFLLLYPTAIALGCLLARRHLGRSSSRLSAWGRVLARAQVATAGFDAVENWALLRILGGESGAWAATAAVFASLKFGLVLAGLLYAAAGCVRWLGGRIRRSGG